MKNTDQDTTIKKTWYGRPNPAPGATPTCQSKRQVSVIANPIITPDFATPKAPSIPTPRTSTKETPEPLKADESKSSSVPSRQSAENDQNVDNVGRNSRSSLPQPINHGSPSLPPAAYKGPGLAGQNSALKQDNQCIRGRATPPGPAGQPTPK